MDDVDIYDILNVCDSICSTNNLMYMKINETIKQDIRNEISRIILSSLYSDKKRTLEWILRRFGDNGVQLSLEGLIELSEDFNSFIPPSPYNHDTRRMYKVTGLDGVMTYTQFIFELPRIWYATLYRLICEWNDEFNGGVETAY